MTSPKIGSARAATAAYRLRLADRGLTRIELRARREDRELLRAIASDYVVVTGNERDFEGVEVFNPRRPAVP